MATVVGPTVTDRGFDRRHRNQKPRSSGWTGPLLPEATGQRLSAPWREPSATMEITRDLIESKAAEYEAEEALFAVEDEQVTGLPGAFASGNYGRRDAEWVVRWYFRRHLGAYPDADRRAREEAFRENDFEAVRDAIETAVAADDLAGKVEPLVALSGVDVPVASAFLQFLEPGRYVAVSEREWAALRSAGALPGPVPAPPAGEGDEAYLDACRTVADRTGCDLLSVQRALWRLSGEGRE